MKPGERAIFEATLFIMKETRLITITQMVVMVSRLVVVTTTTIMYT